MNLSDFTIEQLLEEAGKKINCLKSNSKGVIIIGNPGSNKYNQTLKIKERFCICHLSIKQLLEESFTSRTEISNQKKNSIIKDKSIADDLLLNLIDNALKLPECRDGFTISDFPQTLNQANLLDKILKKHGKKSTTSYF